MFYQLRKFKVLNWSENNKTQYLFFLFSPIIVKLILVAKRFSRKAIMYYIMYWDNSFMDFVILRKKNIYYSNKYKTQVLHIMYVYWPETFTMYTIVYSTIERFMFNIHEHGIRYTFDNLKLTYNCSITLYNMKSRFVPVMCFLSYFLNDMGIENVLF